MKHTMHGKKLLTNKKATQSSSQKEPIDEIRKMFVLVINKINGVFVCCCPVECFIFETNFILLSTSV